MKQLIVFDLDGTLAKSKSPLDSEMAKLLNALFALVNVAVISGGRWAQFEAQVLSHLAHDERLKRLSLLPTCGTKFFAYDGSWKELYSEDLSADDKKKILGALKKALSETGLEEKKTWGDAIEDRGTQITFSALGQAAPLDAKANWDPDFAKAYGIHKLRDILGISLEDMLFVGDALFVGGNDRPAMDAGVTSIQVRDPDETKRVIETLVACLEPHAAAAEKTS
jgi:hydroxymethylpyrimidine pyrophosphatase-like HAD family hydrolase